MKLRIRIYTGSEHDSPPVPVAIVVVSDEEKQACWRPETSAAGARFFLERIETNSPEIEQRIRSVLLQPSVPVSRAVSYFTETVRMRGDYWADEPHGTPTYWRSAIGLLEGEAGLTYDLQDYVHMLQEMEADAPVAAKAEPAVADRSRDEAS